MQRPDFRTIGDFREPCMRRADAVLGDAKTIGRWGAALGPAVIKQIHQRMVQIAREEQVVAGRRMRVDTMVVETNIHYPTDSSRLGDGSGS